MSMERSVGVHAAHSGRAVSMAQDVRVRRVRDDGWRPGICQWLSWTFRERCRSDEKVQRKEGNSRGVVIAGCAMYEYSKMVSFAECTFLLPCHVGGILVAMVVGTGAPPANHARPQPDLLTSLTCPGPLQTQGVLLDQPRSKNQSERSVDQ